MRGPTYSEADLFALRDSPLVKKPDSLPSISQWMDVPADQTTNNGHANNNGAVRRARGMRDGEGCATTEQRPMINPMGQFGRRQSMRKSPEAQGIKAAINALFVEPGEETVLGPPKLAFLSARQVKPTGDTKERTAITSTDGEIVGDRFPKNERWTRDRENDRTRDKGFTNGRRGGREDGEPGWQNVKGRKSLGQEDFERFTRNGDRNREKHEGDAETDVAPRRGNRERNEPRWGRRDEGKEEGTKAGVQGGWRDRDRERERDSGREWNRGANRGEEDPEWMDTKVEKKEFKPRTQEDFQRWKEQMRAKDTPADEPREAPPEIPTAIAITAPPMLTAPLHTPTTEPTQGILFGNWGRDKSEDVPPSETISARPRTEKKSRFMGMFAKAEEPATQSQPPAPAPASPAPAPEGNADKEGFQRILQMLGQVNPSQPSMPAPTNGTRHSGGISLDLYQQSPPPEPQHGRAPPRTLEQQSILENILAPRPAPPESRPSQQSRFASMSPDNGLSDQFRLPRPESNQPKDLFTHQPPPPRNNMPDANLAAILNSRGREESQRDEATKQRERDFLLNLMQQPTRATPPQNQNLPRPPQENHNMAFFEQHRQQPQQLQQQSKGRGGFPPGLMDDPRMYAEHEMMRRDDRREQLELANSNKSSNSKTPCAPRTSACLWDTLMRILSWASSAVTQEAIRACQPTWVFRHSQYQTCSTWADEASQVCRQHPKNDRTSLHHQASEARCASRQASVASTPNRWVLEDRVSQLATRRLVTLLVSRRVVAFVGWVASQVDLEDLLVTACKAHQATSRRLDMVDLLCLACVVVRTLE
jgi:hypothetical protein